MLSFSLAALAVFGSVFDVRNDDPAQRTALTRFYRALGGDKWLNTTNWLQDDASYCTWHGITCGPATSQGHNVGSITLPANNLTGIIPSMPELKFISNFGVLNNAFTPQPIPDDLYGFGASLRSLWLCNNYITGEIPNSLAERAPHLRAFGCKHCNLTGPVPANWASMKFHNVFLESNHLTSMPMGWAKPTCQNPDGSYMKDCCDLVDNPWKCPIDAWTETAGGGPDHCNRAATCT